MSIPPPGSTLAAPAGLAAERSAAPADPSAARARPRRRARRWAGRSVGLSLALHGLAALALVALPTSKPPGLEREGREYVLEVARQEPREAPPEEPAETVLEPTPVEPEPPELVPQELPDEPPPDDAPPSLDDRFALDDPLERVTETEWPDRAPAAQESAPPPPETSPEPTPPPPAPRPREAESPAEHVPLVLHAPAPSYPRAAQRLGLEGSVELRAQVDREGEVRAVEVLASSGHALLDEAARETLAEWRFRPWRPGEPDPRTYRKTFTFRLPR